MNLPKWLVDFYIRCTRETEKSSLKQLSIDKHTENYSIPKHLKFPRPIEKKEMLGIEVFESPGANEDSPILLYLHGGAYIHPFSPFHWKFLIEMAKVTGCALVVPNYLMMPKWTAKISNEVTMNWYEEFSKTHDMSKVIIAGDSAGGGLACVVLQRAIKIGLPIPQKAILISPWVDVTGGSEAKSKVDNMINYKMVAVYGEAWQKGIKDKDPFASPLYGDFAKFPQTLLFIGGNEVLYDDVMSMYQKMVDKNIDVKLSYIENEGHVFPLYPTRNGAASRKQAAEFILK